MRNKLLSNFECNKLYCTRCGHSTDYVALILVDQIITDIDNNEEPLRIFLDLSKAYDT